MFSLLPIALIGLAQSVPPPLPVERAIVVRADPAKSEIERILAADNLDTVRTDPALVVRTMDAISPGRAPADFWKAYQAHRIAWRRLADLQGDGTATDADRITAERALNATFEEVERVALRHGARLPMPLVRLKPVQPPPTK